MQDLQLLINGATFHVILLETIPIWLAALGGAFTAQANVLNIALEGMILIGAFTAVAIGSLTQSATLAVLSAVLAGIALALVFAWVTLYLRADVIVAGLGISLVAEGVTVFLLERVYSNEGSYQPNQFPHLWTVDIGPLAKIPLIGPAIQGQTIIVFIALFLLPFSSWLLFRTRFGLRVRAVGEAEDAAVAAGINPNRMKLWTILISGAFSGLAGAQLAMATIDMFVRDMSAGRGYIALAALTFGAGNPVGTFVASLIFGAATALADRLQLMNHPNIPSQFALMVPYVVTLIALIFAAFRLRLASRPAEATLAHES
jgi:ABC-type uncharacterized transport system permease subunit